MTTVEIELAVANFFNTRRHLIVPNISWGLGLHECDMLIITKFGYVTEIEIKVNRYDLKKDQKKWHGHRSNKIKRLFFGIPYSLLTFKEYIPERAGIIVVYPPNLDYPITHPYIKNAYNCKIERSAKINRDAKPLTPEQILHLGRLASMRIWTLKQAILNRNNNNHFILTWDEAVP